MFVQGYLLNSVNDTTKCMQETFTGSPSAGDQQEISWNIASVSQLIAIKWHIYALVDYAIISSDNGLLPEKRQAIIWTKAGLLLVIF